MAFVQFTLTAVLRGKENFVNIIADGTNANRALLVLAAGVLAVQAVRYGCHWLLIVLDWLHRRACRRHHRQWGFQTVPHIRPIKREPEHPLAHWALEEEEGRQRWVYRGKGYKQRFQEQYHLGLAAAPSVAEGKAPSKGPREPNKRANASKSPDEALRLGADFLCSLQSPDGHWANDYSGPLFLTPGAIITKYICFDGRADLMYPSDHHRLELLRYLVNLQNADGGFGVHTEGHSTMMGTSLNYVAMRLLGEPADSAPCVAARSWIRSRGGAVSAPAWAKVWLAVLGVYHWDGVDPVPAELLLIPDWMPFAFGRTWCHARIVSCPFSYLYSTRFVARDGKLQQSLRSELYVEPYASIRWAAHRSKVFKDDVYLPHSLFFRLATLVLRAYEALPVKPLRGRALRLCLDHMVYDDKLTDYICLGPVNKSLHMLITWTREGRGPAFQRHCERMDDYFWLGPEGMRMSGYNGSQLWDTSFSVQALMAAQQQGRHAQEIAGGHHYVDIAQVLTDPPARERYYHNKTKGAWNFSTRQQGWQVSDCTAEGLRVVLLCRADKAVVPAPAFPQQRIFDAVDEILHLRNTNGEGGWASYEPSRAPSYVELLNCSDVFKDIMIDYTYAECSSSCVHSLVLFQRQFPDYRAKEVRRAIAEGAECVRRKQRADGSWYGSWGVCFTYAAWLATEALHLAGEPRQSPTFRRCCRFLLSKQREDGGWGEDFNSCVTGEWVDSAEGSQVVNTAWAVMALIVASGFGAEHLAAIERGVRFLVDRQLSNGDWVQNRITGVFNGSCAIHSPGYKNQMPVWALGKYQAMVNDLAKRATAPASGRS